MDLPLLGWPPPSLGWPPPPSVSRHDIVTSRYHVITWWMVGGARPLRWRSVLVGTFDWKLHLSVLPRVESPPISFVRGKAQHFSRNQAKFDGKKCVSSCRYRSHTRTRCRCWWLLPPRRRTPCSVSSGGDDTYVTRPGRAGPRLAWPDPGTAGADRGVRMGLGRLRGKPGRDLCRRRPSRS